jgi:hypothetical protein
VCGRPATRRSSPPAGQVVVWKSDRRAACARPCAAGPRHAAERGPRITVLSICCVGTLAPRIGCKCAWLDKRCVMRRSHQFDLLSSRYYNATLT